MNRDIAAVVIGRNEGERLARCLASLSGIEGPIVYVDSGSTDQSVAIAHTAGAEIVALDDCSPFTAARARNAGFQRLLEKHPKTDFVQFVDGDCEVVADWIERAAAALRSKDDIAVVCGRRRERYPNASLWNELIDAEWNTPIGETNACGGDAMIRCSALEEIGGYRPDLIAGEEPEMCLRLRARGWRIWRLDAEMTLHDAAMSHFGQWWRRCRRGGHAFAEVSSIHRENDERLWVAETRRALLWGAGLPVLLLAGTLVSPWALVGLSIYPMQVLRLNRRGMGLKQALFTVVSKFPEAQGVIGYYIARVQGKQNTLIEYK